MECSKDCSWDEWTQWTNCTQSCGGGERTKSRAMIPKSGGGSECEGGSTLKEFCNKDACKVDCVWADWSEWSNCSTECDEGTKTRSRSPIQDAVNGGLQCIGETSQTDLCNSEKCEETCTGNKIWTTECYECPYSCGTIANPSGCQETETCVPACRCANDTVMNDEGDCIEVENCGCRVGDKEYMPQEIVDTGNNCEECKCEDGKLTCVPRECSCEWSTWQEWGECNADCGEGKKIRLRTKINPEKPGCEGDNNEESLCEDKPCPNCVDRNGTIFIDGATINSTMCVVCYCEAQNTGIRCQDYSGVSIDGGWGEWDEWSTCSKNCDAGIQTRSRLCNSPFQQCKGNQCMGDRLEEKSCNSDVPCNETTTSSSTDTTTISSECIVNGKSRENDTMWFDEQNICMMYQCIDRNVIETNMIDMCTCGPDEIRKDNPNMCCYCEKKELGRECQLRTSTTSLSVPDPDNNTTMCESGPVSLNYCEGSCDSNDHPVFFYQNKALHHEKNCKCCTGTGSRKAISFTCPGGVSKEFEVLNLNACQCMGCIEQDTQQTQPEP